MRGPANPRLRHLSNRPFRRHIFLQPQFGSPPSQHRSSYKHSKNNNQYDMHKKIPPSLEALSATPRSSIIGQFLDERAITGIHLAICDRWGQNPSDHELRRLYTRSMRDDSNLVTQGVQNQFDRPREGQGLSSQSSRSLTRKT
jgi:hypothetical protein